jgi:hypothetical protein
VLAQHHTQGTAFGVGAWQTGIKLQNGGTLFEQLAGKLIELLD